VAGAAALLLLAVAVAIIGQPDAEDKWVQIAPEKEASLNAREVQIEPGELLSSMANDSLNLVMLDVRSEADYNLFHIEGARNIELDELGAIVPELLSEPSSSTIFVLMSNDEAAATQAWKLLTAESVSNLYILEGGINEWLSTFAAEEPQITPTPVPPGHDRLGFKFTSALGARYDASFPNPHEWELEYTPKIKLEQKRSPSGGGCG
jgi:hypothetical protein